jgi:hypothetical protein
MWRLRIPSFECAKLSPYCRLKKVELVGPRYKPNPRYPHTKIDTARKQRVNSIEPLQGLHDTFCFTESREHKGVFNNVLTHQCNLAEAFPPRCDGPEQFYAALKYATFYASTVSLLPTHRPETNAVIGRNRRIGVSISGVAQWASGAVPDGWGPMNYTKMTTFLRKGYHIVKDTNTKLAKEAGVPPSIRVGTIKPSGSISLLAGVTPGVHYPVSRYAIRRMRIGKDSPLVPALAEAGIPYEDDQYSDNTLVFEFAVDHGNVRPCEEVSPWEQFSLVAMLQRFYADNCVSACLTGGHYIHTSNGFFALKEICQTAQTRGFHPHDVSIFNRDGELEESPQFYYNGKQATVTIQLENGFDIKGTPRHKLLVAKGEKFVWKRLDELSLTDILVGRIGDDQWGSLTQSNNILEQFESDSTSPRLMTKNLAHWLGMTWIPNTLQILDDHTVCYTHADPEETQYWAVLASALFKLEAFEYKTHGDTLSVTVTSDILVNWLKWAGLTRLPSIIMRSSKCMVKFFLQRLCSSATFEGETNTTLIHNVPYHIATGLHVLLNNFGITGTMVSVKHISTKREDYTLNAHNTYLFHELIGFNNTTNISVPEGYSKTQQQSYSFNTIQDIRFNHKPTKTYDISTELTHSYVANGLISHNTIYFDKEKDGPDVEKMLAMYIPILKSVSMLPHSGHGFAQAPYEPCTKEQYEERRASYHLPDFDKVAGIVPVGSKFCSGDTCEL